MDTIEIEATGFPPEQIAGRQVALCIEDLDGKRGVKLRLIRTEDDDYVAVVTYWTVWEMERPFTWAIYADTLQELAELVRERAKDVLPPGAGYPATPHFADRQRKLREQLETLTLVALSDCLKQSSSSMK